MNRTSGNHGSRGEASHTFSTLSKPSRPFKMENNTTRRVIRPKIEYVLFDMDGRFRWLEKYVI